MIDTRASNQPNCPALLLARHGETDFNLNKIFQGRIDNPLNQTGMKQAQLIRSILRDIPLSHAFTSPLVRAMKTAEIALDSRNVPITADNRIIEIDFGDWEAVPEAEVKEKYMEEYLDYRKDMSRFHPSGGESARDAWGRSGAWWDEIKGSFSPDDTIIVFAHQSINACLGCYVAEIDLSQAWEKFKTAPGEVIKIVPGRVAMVSRLSVPID